MRTSRIARNMVAVALAAASVIAGTIVDVEAQEQIQWDSAPAQQHRGENGKQFSYTCPPESGQSYGVNQWGTDVYTDDSRICPSAVHAGVITTAGGTVTIEIRPGQSSYEGSTRHGVQTGDWPDSPGSFVFVTSAGQPRPSGGLTGAWHQQGGGPVEIRQDGDKITGNYGGGSYHPNLKGTFSGTLDGRHLVADCDVHEDTIHKTCKLDLTLSEDGTKLEGTYVSTDGTMHGDVEWVRGQ